jgi:GntR family transcriptional regulator
MSTEPELVLQNDAPLHRQIREQIRACILNGSLRPGEQLPTVRSVAVELRVNPGVVHKAYDALEHDGLLTTEDGSGVLVAGPEAGLRGALQRRGRLEEFCAGFLERARVQGYGAEEVLHTTQTLLQRRVSS